MEYWRERGWSDADIKHQWSLWFVNRDEDGKVVRSSRKGNTRSIKAVTDKAIKKGIIDDRRTYTASKYVVANRSLTIGLSAP